jgi:hypothetical protein
MAKYLLRYTGGGMPETEEEIARVMAAWGAWYTSLGNAVADPGNPFTPAAKTVASSSALSNGVTGPMATGYTILQADSLKAAAKMAQTCPVLAGSASISIYETFEGM